LNINHSLVDIQPFKTSAYRIHNLRCRHLRQLIGIAAKGTASVRDLVLWSVMRRIRLVHPQFEG
jgi:hypothetical protein